MRIEALKYRSENNLDIIIFVDFNVLSEEHIKRWSIAEIAYKKLLINRYNFLSDTYRDEDEYFQTTPDERAAFVLKKQIEFVGAEKLKEALLAAWNMVKPDTDQILGLNEMP